jgi:hypothetical protein
MITLISKQSQQIQFPGNPSPRPNILPAHTVTVETGVAVFTLLGTNPHDWTRDTLSFPVGAPCPPAEFASGIASASPASFWTPLDNEVHGPTIFDAPVQVAGVTDDGHRVSASGAAHIIIPFEAVPPPFGCAVDSASVAYSSQAGQPVIQLALAVFGNCTALLRVSYTAYIVNNHGGIVIGPGGGGVSTTSG